MICFVILSTSRSQTRLLRAFTCMLANMSFVNAVNNDSGRKGLFPLRLNLDHQQGGYETESTTRLDENKQADRAYGPHRHMHVTISWLGSELTAHVSFMDKVITAFNSDLYGINPSVLTTPLARPRFMKANADDLFSPLPLYRLH
jgi:hypothetical protein